MSYDKEDTSNIENDMVEESHIHKVKEDAYHVASSNGPGLIITTVQLKENDKDNNYVEWTKAIRLALRTIRGRGSSGRRALGCASFGAQRTGLDSNRQGSNAAAGLHGGSSGTASIKGEHGSGDSSNGSNKFGNFPNLSYEQWSKLLTLLDTSNPTQTDALAGMETLWILDSGCFYHMTGRKDFLKFNCHSSIHCWTT
ncbi:hypothetical protein M9H77_31389 [Catharanthus roseus]|uniref:Uncharacterized protein n=1 Tax=Catharanthus roseus TaxID=4058 RepID=A0ACC0A179_CATRO|nr:hypothetical protein M9H77_31389 [Catharanthus roseus]